MQPELGRFRSPISEFRLKDIRCIGPTRAGLARLLPERSVLLIASNVAAIARIRQKIGNLSGTIYSRRP